MDNIVKRLRECETNCSDGNCYNEDMMAQAADEIERLRAALEHIAELPDVRCDEAPTVARNTLNDGTRAPPQPASQ